VFDFLDAVEGLAKLGEKTDISISDLVQTTRKRIANSAQSEGYEGLDESYQRVHEAAKQVGLAAFFRSTNKLLSKFAHPTAMMVFSLLDESSRTQFCEFFIVFGSVLCISSMAEFERYAKALGSAIADSNPDVHN
jgi:hypothetical protein